MPRNLELKARIESLRSVRPILNRIHAHRVGLLIQKDTYFCVPSGRLKVRTSAKSRAELIFYRRSAKQGGRYSTFTRMPLRSKAVIMKALTSIFGVRCIVKKRRELYLYKNARIHLDRVESLGEFVEFEVMVTRGVRQAEKLLQFLIDEFRFRKADTVAGSYADLIMKRPS